jgi:hypothetical protein
VYVHKIRSDQIRPDEIRSKQAVLFSSGRREGLSLYQKLCCFFSFLLKADDDDADGGDAEDEDDGSDGDDDDG